MANRFSISSVMPLSMVDLFPQISFRNETFDSRVIQRNVDPKIHSTIYNNLYAFFRV